MFFLSIPLYGFVDTRANSTTSHANRHLSIPLYGFGVRAQAEDSRGHLSIPLYGFPGTTVNSDSVDVVSVTFQFHCMDSAPSRFMFTVEISLISIEWIRNTCS
jgi:hypothetical protein